MENDSEHIGNFIRTEIFPPGMTVTAAAKLLKIGRPRLSMVLNGRAKLSSGLAKRMEAAFGFPAEDLMNRQSFRKEEDVKRNDAASVPVGSYVPPFLQVRASQIEKWASGIEARARLAVLLRTLVNSTGSGLKKVDFPGNDDAERKGWDGFVKADKARPWVPEGTSCWEFGCDKNVKRKADGDFVKRTRDFPPGERENVTFVFVTPRRWAGKNDWEEKRRAEKQWKDVRVFDASDLEQWMEQSIPAQAWFADETGVPNEGVLSLEACWNEWEADCEPALAPALFDQALNEHKNKVLNWLAGEADAPLTISADSSVEALAFLRVLFSVDESTLRENGDKVVVFRESGVVPKIVAPGSDMIAVSTSREIESELASRGRSVRTILVYPRKIPYAAEPDIDLKPLNPFAFDSALEKMRCTRDEIDRYRRESGFSLTVLRRRLSKRRAVRTPDWAGDEKYRRSLIAAMLAGTWDTANPVDRILVSELAGGDPYEETERKILDLQTLDDSPVWFAGTHLGVKSKIDILFAVSGSVAQSDVDRFFEVAEIIITEDNPALGLPDDKRWMANLYGKSREVSDMLRRSVMDSFVLLAVCGRELFRDRNGFDIEARVRKMVKKWFRPGDGRALESRKDALPAYAEADPDAFLSIIEKDLEGDEPGILGLFRPVEAPPFIAPSPPRVELLWALESLAWSGDHLPRVATILARLAEKETGDNWGNSSMKSLRTIFQSRAPQTSTSVDGQISVFNRLLDDFPDIGWILCLDQFAAGAWWGEFSYRPRWRTDGHGHGWGAWDDKRAKFVLNAVEKAIRWPSHTEETLADLVANFENIPIELWPRVWQRIEDWCVRENPADGAKARLRETIRVSGCLSLMSLMSGEVAERGRKVRDMLEPSDIVIRHEWLFLSSVFQIAKGEVEASGLEFSEYLSKSEEETEKSRISALREIYSRRGVSGLIDLAQRGEGQTVVGSLALRIPGFDESEVKTLIWSALEEVAGDNRRRMENLIGGVLGGLEETRRENMLREFLEAGPGETFLKILSLAPFRRETWNFLDELPDEQKLRYWKEVDPGWGPDDPVDLNEVAGKLTEAGRPLSAVALVRYRLEELEPRCVLLLLEAIARGQGEKRRQDHPPDEFFVENAFKRLDGEKEIPRDRIADLEFEFVGLLKRSDRGVLNLERRVGDDPGIFAEIVSLAYPREDSEESASESSVSNDERERKAYLARVLLDALRRIPGQDASDEADKTKRLIGWIRKARAQCESRGRLRICDDRIGTLLSKSPPGEDGIWPCESVREALEKFYSEEVGIGFHVGCCNARSSHVGSFSGDQEREIESEYREWADKTKYSHQRTSRILRKLADDYRRMGKHYDDFAETIYRRESYS